MKYIVLGIATFTSLNTFAYTIQCEKNVSASNHISVKIEESDSYPEFGWKLAKIANKYVNPDGSKHAQGNSFSVYQTSRENKLLFYSLNSKEEFTLDLGEFKGEGTYNNVNLGINSNTWFGRKLEVDCKVTGEIPFINYCVSTKKWNPETGLLQATKNRNLDLVEATLACGVDANIKDKNNCTPTLLASDSNCGTGFNRYQSPSSKSLKPILGILINSGAYLDEVDPSTGESSFLKLVKFMDHDSAQLLLDLEADINLQDLEGYTALMRAVENSDYHMVFNLIASGADTSLRNKKDKTALEIARIWGKKKIIELLEEPQNIVTIQGNSDGSCSQTEIRLPVNKVARIVLKATQNQMFKFESEDLDIEIVASANSQGLKNILPKRVGEFEYMCGLHHGGNSPTMGKIIVE